MKSSDYWKLLIDSGKLMNLLLGRKYVYLRRLLLGKINDIQALCCNIQLG